MAKKKNNAIYAWSEKTDVPNFPLPRGMKFGTAKQILRQMGHNWLVPIKGRTVPGDYRKWDDSSTIVCYIQEAGKDDSVIVKRVHPSVLVHAAKDPRADVNPQELKDIAESICDALASQNIDIKYATYAVMVRGWKTTLTLNNGYANPVVYTTDKITISVDVNIDVVNTVNLPIPSGWYVDMCLPPSQCGTVIELTRLYNFYVTDEDDCIDEDRLKELFDEHIQLRKREGMHTRSPNYDLKDFV